VIVLFFFRAGAGECSAQRLGVFDEFVEAGAHGLHALGLGGGEVVLFGNILGKILELHFVGGGLEEFPLPTPTTGKLRGMGPQGDSRN